MPKKIWEFNFSKCLNDANLVILCTFSILDHQKVPKKCQNGSKMPQNDFFNSLNPKKGFNGKINHENDM